MQRIWHPYTDWEDYKAGFFDTTIEGDRNTAVSESFALLADPSALGKWMSKVLVEWPVSCEANLSYTGMNRRAWLGQAACCLALGYPSFVTKRAWHQLEEDQQDLANQEADIVIREWEDSIAETLFG